MLTRTPCGPRAPARRGETGHERCVAPTNSIARPEAISSACLTGYEALANMNAHVRCSRRFRSDNPAPEGRLDLPSRPHDAANAQA